jgi:hypothetical protein
MFDINPFAELSYSISPTIMQGFVIVMLVCVAGGTIFDIIHKGSAKYFFGLVRKGSKGRLRDVPIIEKTSVAVRTTAHDVLASGEFCNTRRRVAHLLTMYGFLAYVISTAVMVFAYPTPATPAPGALVNVWWVGAAMISIGCYWFWFFIRVDVASEGNSPFRMIRADLFVVALMLSSSFALIWGYFQVTGHSWSFFALGMYLLTTAVLFGSVPWSKFSHMFFKPAAAYQKNMAKADGGRRNLPPPSSKPEIYGKTQRHSHNY